MSALFDVKSMPERVTGSVSDRKAAMVICLVFALLALTLSAIGIYGVIGFIWFSTRLQAFSGPAPMAQASRNL